MVPRQCPRGHDPRASLSYLRLVHIIVLLCSLGSTQSHFSNPTTFDSSTPLVVPLMFVHGSIHIELQVGRKSGPVSHNSTTITSRWTQPQLFIVDTGSHWTAMECTHQPIIQRKRKLKSSFMTSPSIEWQPTSLLGRPKATATTTSSQPLQRSQKYTIYNPQDSLTVLIQEPNDCELTTHNMVRGSTSNSNQDLCWVEQKYTEGSSWKAYEINEWMALSSSSVYNTTTSSRNDTVNDHHDEDTRLWNSMVPMTVGCQTMVSGLFRQQYANGILGLEQAKDNSMNNYAPGIQQQSRRQHNSLVQRLYENKVIGWNAFSLCVGTEPTVIPDTTELSTKGGSGGFMGFGGALQDLHSEPMQYTPMLSNDVGHYAIRVNQVWLGSTCLINRLHQPSHDAAVRALTSNLRPGVSPTTSTSLYKGFDSGKGTLLDSGTTDTFLPASMARIVEHAWKNQTGREWERDRTHSYTYKEFANLPTWVFVFENNVTLAVPPLHYLEDAVGEEWKGTRELTNRIYTDEPRGAVLGLNVQRGYDILYDVQGGRIGMAKADCDRAKYSLSGEPR